MPGTFVDVQALDVDYLSFSFHKMLAPFGVGVLYAKEQLLQSSLPFLYGGDMIAEGQVSADHVDYNALPWKFAAGTPNILGTIVSAQALRMLLDLALTPNAPPTSTAPARSIADAVQAAMQRIGAWNRTLTAHALERLRRDARPHDLRPARRVAPQLAGGVQRRRPQPDGLAEALNAQRHRVARGLPLRDAGAPAAGARIPASCRLSFYFYNTLDEVDRAVDALEAVLSGNRVREQIWSWLRSRPTQRLRRGVVAA